LGALSTSGLLQQPFYLHRHSNANTGSQQEQSNQAEPSLLNYLLAMRIPTSLFLTMLPFCIAAQIVPSESTYNEGVVWESVFTDGPEGKVNRGLVDSEGHAVCVSMPENQARVHKIDGSDGALIWSVAFTNRVGFGICEIQGIDGQPDYIITGGAGETQECWLARIEGSDGGLMWESIIDHAGQNWQFDGIRTAMIGDDGYIYGSGFIGGDEPNTIFVVFAGQELVLKADPANGEIAWTSAIDASEYGLATVQDSSGELYTGGVMYDEGWCITKRSVDDVHRGHNRNLSIRFGHKRGRPIVLRRAPWQRGRRRPFRLFLRCT
jgi:hypothetical protein